MKLHTYQAGTPRKRGEGLRLGTVRYLPRGTKKGDYARKDFFDVWMPALAPSRELLSEFKVREQKGAEWETLWPSFKKRYEREMLGSTDKRQTLLMLARLAEATPIAIGCYCPNEARCHRSLLRALILRAASGKL